MTDTPSTTAKIVIVAGQSFAVDAATDNEAIRAQLLGMGFADVAKPAEIKLGTTADGTVTVEFIKKAGTKGAGGLTPVALAEALRRTPHAPNPRDHGEDPLVRRLLAGTLTCADALDFLTANVLEEAHFPDDARTTTEEFALCDRLDHLSAIADIAPSAW